MEGLQKKVDKLINLIEKVETLVSMEFELDIDKTEDVNGENEEYFYTVTIPMKTLKLPVLKEVSYETAIAYFTGVLVGYDYCQEKALRTIHCN